MSFGANTVGDGVRDAKDLIWTAAERGTQMTLVRR